MMSCGVLLERWRGKRARHVVQWECSVFKSSARRMKCPARGVILEAHVVKLERRLRKYILRVVKWERREVFLEWRTIKSCCRVMNETRRA